MDLTHLFPQDYIVSQWSGGATMQIAISPRNAVYANRDFLWRVSSASVDLEESTFTPLNDYHRWIAPIKGNMRLFHANGSSATLPPYSVYQFDGALPTHSQGRCTDFNLMLRKSKAYGLIRSLELSVGAIQNIAVQSIVGKHFSKADLLVFCCAGMVDIEAGGGCIRLSPLESVLAADADSLLKVSAINDSVLMIAEILT